MKNGTASKMECGQLAELAAAIIRQLPHVEGLGEVAQGWIENGAALKKVLTEALVPLVRASNALLEEVGIVNLPSIGKFIARSYFTRDSKEVKFYGFGSNFENNFLDKVEEAQAETTLRISKLKKDSLDKPILDELGCTKETTLANIRELLKKQPKGESGKLLTNGYANIFYVRDAVSVLWAVGVYWLGVGWRVHAYSVSSPNEWGGGYQVFSRNS